MQYIFMPELREVLVYFQCVPDTEVTLETLHQDKRPVILFSHGNAEDVGSYFNYCRWLATKTNCHVLTYDYFNYGLSSMAPTNEEYMLQCATAVYNFVKSKSSCIFLVGKSIGTVPSIYLASLFSENIAGLVLISPLASGIRCLSISHFLTQSMLSSFDSVFGDSLSRIVDVKCPVLFLHGLQDTVVPSYNTDVLYKALVQNVSQKNAQLPVFFGNQKNPGTHDNLETKFEQLFVRALCDFIHIHQACLKK